MKQVGSGADSRESLLAGTPMEQDIRKSREARFMEHLVKPVNLDQFKALINRVISIDHSGK
jgi:hypothetical protein